MTSNKSSLEPPGTSPDGAADPAEQTQHTELPDPPKHSRRTILAAVGAFALLVAGLARKTQTELTLRRTESAKEATESAKR